MKRDMELVRSILLEISEGHFQLVWSPEDNAEGIKKNHLVAYHLKIMVQAGLLEVGVELDQTNNYFLTQDPMLTWIGHDFLDSISNESVWGKAKEVLKSKGLEIGNIPFSVVTEYIRLEVKKVIGIE